MSLFQKYFRGYKLVNEKSLHHNMFCCPPDVITSLKIAQNCIAYHILKIQKFSKIDPDLFMRGNIMDLYWTNDNEEYNSRFASLIVRITLSWKWNGSLWFLTQFWESITPLKFLEHTNPSISWTSTSEHFSNTPEQ